MSGLTNPNILKSKNVHHKGNSYNKIAIFYSLIIVVFVFCFQIESVVANQMTVTSNGAKLRKINSEHINLKLGKYNSNSQSNLIQIQTNSDDVDENLELLYEKLAKAASEAEAGKLAVRIQRQRLKSGSDTIDLLMSGADRAMHTGHNSRALDILDAVVRLKPEYAEGWNRRATLHYLLGSYDLSISDIEQTLAIEPKHWGALSGLALIMIRLEKPEEALKIYNQVKEIHPFLPSVLESIENLKSEMSGQEL